MNLLIVESPNKISKLKSFLGPGWDVAASVGHIRDLPGKDLSIDKANGYRMLYQINADKKSVVDNLKFKVAQCGKENVYLATDPDREGEAISFHLCAALGLDYKTTKRTTFQEITEPTVKKAVASPRMLDLNLVSAQESRRAIDRLVGYEISPVLWKKLESGLSAGRVQSVALRMSVERERIILNFTDKYTFQVVGFFETPKGDLLRARKKDTFTSVVDARTYLQASVAKQFIVQDVTTKPVEKAPQPPYSTSSLQQDGVKKLKMNVKRVMDVAQKLFEGGHITYMRTDSLNLSDTAIAEAKAQITTQYGETYFQERKFRSKAGSQEAHEAIRPTHWENKTAGDTEEERKLYDLIYRRAMASQMKPARYDETTITLISQVPNDVFTSTAKVLLFDGYLRVYQEETEEEEEENGTIQPVTAGEKLTMLKLEARQIYAKPPKRFDQATLVGELEKKQIGRPSTYASILNTILTKEYVKAGNASGRKVKAEVLTLERGIITQSEKVETIGADKNKLIPTDKGIRLTCFLEANFAKVVDYQFTANCEDLFDQVAEGKRTFGQLVPAFDKELSSLLSFANLNNADIIQEVCIDLGEWEGKSLLVGTGKFGTYVKHDTIHYSAKGRDPQSITLPKAIEIVQAGRANKAREIGSFEGKPMTVGKGQYGTYVQHNGMYANIPEMEPAQVTTAIAIAAIQAKRGADKEKAAAQAQSVLARIGKIELRSGQYGLYVTDGKTKASLPKAMDQETALALTEVECKEIIKKYLKWKKQKEKSK